MNTSKTIVFFGNERLVSGLEKTDAPVLRGLLAHAYDIKAIVSHHSNSKSRTYRGLEVAEIGESHNIPVLLPQRPTEIIAQLAAYRAEIGILVAYGRIIPQSIINLFPKGIVNIHPSLLPKYRGPTPIESAIVAGDSHTGVSIMQLMAGMDTGPIYGQTTVKLHDHETKFDIYDKLSRQGTELLLTLLPRILDGSLQPVPQDGSQATYTQLLNKTDAQLDLTILTAAQAERRVRAYLRFPKSKFSILGNDIIITKAHVSSHQKTPLDLICRDGAFLSVDELIAPSGRHMSTEAFLRGYAAN